MSLACPAPTHSLSGCSSMGKALDVGRSGGSLGMGPSLIREAVGSWGGKQEHRPRQLSLDQGSKEKEE